MTAESYLSERYSSAKISLAYGQSSPLATSLPARDSHDATFPNFGAHRAPLQQIAFTGSVCCEDFGRSWLTWALWASNEPTALLRDWKREMRMSATVKETVFLTHLTKETPKDLGSGLEWGKE